MTIQVSEVLGAAPGSPANFPQMPTVAGDPVVESGSNSDGEWVRWADGTQRTFATGKGTIVTNSSLLQIVQTPPVSFLDNEGIATVVGATTTTSYSGLSRHDNWHVLQYISDETISALSVYLSFESTDVSAASISNLALAIFGRWK